MGIFGRSGFFGKLFDFNYDDELDYLDEAMKFSLLNDVMKEEKEDSLAGNNLEDDFDDHTEEEDE